MRDARDRDLAELLVRYSINLAAGESCLIQAVDVPLEIIEELTAAVYRAGGYPLLDISSERLHRALLEGATEKSMRLRAECELFRMKLVDAFIGIRGPANSRETTDVAEKQEAVYMREYFTPVHHEQRIPHTRWVVLRYPTEIMAFSAGMSTKAFEDFYYAVTTGVDYKSMAEAMKPAAEFITQAEHVHIIGPGTDLTFSIKGLPAIPCDGHMNIPDGEIYTAPVRDSVEGTITYNTPSTYNGFTFSDVKFIFREGRIIDAQANNPEKIHAVLDMDTGAKYIGEFAIGCNPAISHPMDNTLFDEKITGSFHLTPGNAYDDCDNGNRSAVHWDLVSIQTPEYGGGEIWMDGVCIRKDGVFIHDAFRKLNPGNQ